MYVDDLLVTASNKELMAWISDQLRTRWETVYHTGNEFNYVGVHLLSIEISGNVKKLIEEFGKDVHPSSIPATAAVLEQARVPLAAAVKTRLMSLVCLFCISLAWFTWRCCSHAATRIPKVDDRAHAYHLIGFLKTQEEFEAASVCRRFAIYPPERISRRWHGARPQKTKFQPCPSLLRIFR